MASLVCRQVGIQLAKRMQRPLHVSASVFSDNKKKKEYDPWQMADPLDHATGLEKAEMIARLQGNDDPFDTKMMKMGPGTKDCPNLVGSYFNSRLIGCICEEDQCHINWMWLHKGQPRRCECGHWFKLVERAPVQVPDD
ncbi:hypothetical protein QAD02_024292 [Eretmocerus hayati]|uniref:Uncharacterized protein n=1 Tax=Eretmocerus hayati TaxID=131215 RepID=A0ACC2Q1R1_9HYME|nr:hypothetical protein QAD02_024292 [Eretmocerus hayati]